ncbi:MAG TPA: hypothetical protein VL598_10050 [Trinickia sp.]|jgi:hypothetical protein|uniref:hypothetical protein n=1 Tax=Trinickia sp. TaxID=2571163 RepID=UPI002CE7FA55|nr:hypothetical protein [Trinickia sp.]HTI17995.1 hypothetical protein [Trinickia sp.]
MEQTSDTPKKPDLEHPKPVEHSDDEHSRMPEREDQGRKQSPADKPGKTSGEDEPAVG